MGIIAKTYSRPLWAGLGKALGVQGLKKIGPPTHYVSSRCLGYQCESKIRLKKNFNKSKILENVKS